MRIWKEEVFQKHVGLAVVGGSVVRVLACPHDLAVACVSAGHKLLPKTVEPIADLQSRGSAAVYVLVPRQAAAEQQL